MLRSEHEVKDSAQIRAFLERSSVIRVAFNSDSAPYIVPLTYGFDYEEDAGKLTFYFHGAAKGQKLDLAQKNPNVGIEIDNALELKPADKACAFTLKYESIIGSGKISTIDNLDEKKKALNKVMFQFTSDDQWELNEEALNRTVVFKIDVDSFTMKKN